MAYQDNKYRNDHGYNRNPGNYNNQRNNAVSFETVTVPLSVQYKDKAKLYLTDGVAQKTARQFVGAKITTHQLRKVLSQAKQAVTIMESGGSRFNEARNVLFMLLPMSAYNAGRLPAVKPLYLFLKANISEETLKGPEDISVFDSLMTSIVAYHKYEEEQNKNKSGRRS
ncbi:type III-A CRISPR-associated protein Csm2 [Faecalibaculum rodentium]|uniref:CRISPR system Cms protein Csm2 n=1 Tax=Faecalibaculum rodentium TaxID=1702221 RepID=A0A140DRJ8_9FIRM|nr:type III-A CRISPR-associated protein Csm2 [Faecalibaculum rodentium]AMK53275.1 hypothetical protein AALO17_01410 [Faecalibaculum rodentium]